MGGSSSRFETIVLPKPTTPTTGITISTSKPCVANCSQCPEGEPKTKDCCTPCSLLVPANVSSSAVILSRTSTASSTCPQGWSTNKFSVPRDGYEGECTKDGTKILLGTGPFSSSTKLFIKPTIPFKIMMNGKAHDISTLTLYHPSPVRIENVQHDAVLSLGDPSVGSPFVVLIPIVSSSLGGPAANFVGKIVSQMASFITTDTTTPPEVSVSTGADWNLSSVIPVGERSLAKGSFFTWIGGAYEQYRSPKSTFYRTILDWKPMKPETTYVLMAEPIKVNPTDLTEIMRLPITKPDDSIHQITNVQYKPGIRKSAASPQTIRSVTNVSSPTKIPILELLMIVLTGILTLVGIHYGLTWALDKNKGTILRRWGDVIAKTFPKKVPVPPTNPQLS
jgi:hypothetical protein